MTNRTILKWFVAIVGVEVLSALVIFNPTANTVCALTIAVVVGILAVVIPEYALSILAVEVIIGSLGELFKAFGDASNHGPWSVRILIFIAFFLGWLIWSVKHKTYRQWKSYIKSRTTYLVLTVMIVLTVMNGLLRHNPFIFADANAWGFWLLLLPVLDLVRHRHLEIERTLVPAVLAALSWLCAKTLLVAYLFSHAFPEWLTSPAYLWIRRTGVGEITPIKDNASRIFFQSQIFAIVAYLVGTLKLIGQQFRKDIALLVTVSFSVILISLSRSFWIGLAAAILVGITFVLRRKSKSLFRSLNIWLGLSFAGLLVVLAVGFFPLPKSNFDLIGLLTSRVNLEESAAVSRWQMLPKLWDKIVEHPILGSGFGATVTFQSADPRIVAATGGQTTAYMFEWGWLDIWIKFGIFGLLAMVAVLLSIGFRAWRSALPEWAKYSVVTVLVMLSVIHFFTPYLNHPLGISMLIAMEGLIECHRYA